METTDKQQYQDMLPRLRRVSEIDREDAPTMPLARVVSWVREFLAKPHPDVGRKGAVCPFVPTSLMLDTIWLAEIPDASPDVEVITRIITEYRDLFLSMEPKVGPEALQKAFMVVFPGLESAGPEAAALVDQVQYTLKKFFVDMGLMLGEFHARNNSPGLRNPDFRPLRSPIPMLAIRYMVESDLPFLAHDLYPPNERASFLRSYLTRLSGTGNLNPARFDLALDGLVNAEIELRAIKGIGRTDPLAEEEQASAKHESTAVQSV